MKCINPFFIQVPDKNRYFSRYPDGLKVPCGKCLLCRMKRRQEWAMRILHESEFWDKSIFVTLTYDDNSVPVSKYGMETLRKTDVQKFIKKLRRYLYPNRDIKYLVSGEYSRVLRPHYHGIIFGLDIRDKELIMDKWEHADWRVKAIADKAFGLVEPKSIMYVTKYLDKLYYGDKEFEEYGVFGMESPFKLQSNGMGKRYALKYRDKLQRGYDTVLGRKQALPRYYIDVADLDADSIKDQNEKRERLEMQSMTDCHLTYDEYYVVGNANDVIKHDKRKMDSNIQRERDLSKLINLKDEFKKR